MYDCLVPSVATLHFVESENHSLDGFVSVGAYISNHTPILVPAVPDDKLCSSFRGMLIAVVAASVIIQCIVAVGVLVPTHNLLFVSSKNRFALS